LERLSKMLPGSSEIASARAEVAAMEGRWDESISYQEQALALDPRNVGLLTETAWRYITLRDFPAALKLYDRALDIMPNDQDLMLHKIGIYQAEGNLKEAARLLSEKNWQTSAERMFYCKIIQLRLEGNYSEAVRLLQAAIAKTHYDSQDQKG